MQPPQHIPANSNTEEDFSFSKMIRDRWENLLYLWNFRYRILLVAMIGAGFGILLAWLSPHTYTARITFIVEDSKASGGLLSGLAGQIGLDITGLGSTATSGILAGDNVLQLLTSQKILKQAMLTPLDSGNYTLADKYADSYKLREKWKEPVMFPPDSKDYSRLQDSLLQSILHRLAEKETAVIKPDKKLGFFALSTTLRNEALAALVCRRLIDEASAFYIQTRTQRLRTNVDRLKTRADSIERLLDTKTYSTSAANAALLDLNPAYSRPSVNVEVQERDKRILQTIHAEIIKNLEINRTMLIQETPTFQVVDEPDLPLKKNRIGFGYSILSGMFLFSALYSMCLLTLQASKPKSNT